MHLHGFRRSRGKRPMVVLTGAFALCAMLAVLFAPVASAHNSLGTVSLACGGSASFTAQAWAGPTNSSRTNTDVRVFSSVDNGATWTQVGQGQFNQANGFAFSGTFSVGSSHKVRIRVQEFAKWGDGASPSAPGFADATGPSNCSTTTTTTATTTTTPTTTTTRTTTTTPAPPPPPPATPTPPPPATPPPPPATPPPTPTVVLTPAITIVKTERVGTGAYLRGPIGVVAGQTLDYQMIVTNTGNEELTLTLSDPRCDAGTLHAAGTTTLVPGASVTFTCSHRFRGSDASPFVNTATVTAVTASGSKVGPLSSAVVARSAAGVLAAAETVKVVAKARPAKAVVKAARFTG